MKLGVVMRMVRLAEVMVSAAQVMRVLELERLVLLALAQLVRPVLARQARKPLEQQLE